MQPKYIGKYDRRYRKTSDLDAKISVYLDHDTSKWLVEHYKMPLRCALRAAIEEGLAARKRKVICKRRKQVSVAIASSTIEELAQAIQGISTGEAARSVVEELIRIKEGI